jgi:hypothetical protein
VNGNRLFDWDSGSLSEALQEFRMLGDELFGGLKEWRLRMDTGVPPFQVIDEPPHGILLLRRQRPDNVNQAFRGHSAFQSQDTALAPGHRSLSGALREPEHAPRCL